MEARFKVLEVLEVLPPQATAAALINLTPSTRLPLDNGDEVFLVLCLDLFKASMECLTPLLLAGFLPAKAFLADLVRGTASATRLDLDLRVTQVCRVST